jgi:hypothetical protein
MRARDRDVAPGVGADYGLREGVVGIGEAGGVGPARLQRFAGAPDGAFVWTRDSDGGFHLGRMGGPCRRAEGSAAGLEYLRPVEWIERPFGDHEVPAAVAQTFARGGLNFQRTHSDEAERESESLWREWSGG